MKKPGGAGFFHWVSALRVAPNVYNDMDDVEALMQCLRLVSAR